jgi:DNA-binding IclR family transcriptional regulator
LLAYESPDFIDEYLDRPLEALTPHTVTDPVLLRELLAEVREQGYAVTRRDVQLHTGSVAAPVYDARGSVVAALSLIANCADLEDREARLVDAVLQAARSVSLLMGWRPPVAARAAASPAG